MIRRIVSQGWGLLLIFAVWQVWVMSSHYNSIVIVSPVAVVRDIVLHPVIYLLPALWTLGFAVAGLAAGMLLGLLLAIGAWRSQLLSAAHQPYCAVVELDAGRLSDTAAGANLWLPEPNRVRDRGHHDVFPGLCLCGKGLRTLPPGSSEFFAVLAATRGQQLLWLALPAAVPNIAVALRIGAAYSVMVTMISEYLMQTGGLGNMFALTSQAFETERAWGASLVAMALSVALYTAAGALEARVRERYR